MNEKDNVFITYDEFLGKIDKNSQLNLFGASKLGFNILELLKKDNLNVDYFCDNDKEKWGESLLGVKIISPNELKKNSSKNTIILITSVYLEQIKKQLYDMNLKNVYYIIDIDEKLKRFDAGESYEEKKYKRLLKISNSTIISKNFNIDFRNPIEKLYLTVGENCFLECTVIFEKQTGEILIGNRTFIGSGTKLISISKIHIGSDVIISWGCTIYDHNSHSIYWNHRKNDVLDLISSYRENSNQIENKDWSNVKSKPIKICDKAWIGFDVVILKGVTIGEGAVVAARSVVTKDVPPYTVVAGNPARIVKTIEENER